MEFLVWIWLARRACFQGMPMHLERSVSYTYVVPQEKHFSNAVPFLPGDLATTRVSLLVFFLIVSLLAGPEGGEG